MAVLMAGKEASAGIERAARYTRHRPEQTLLYQIVQTHTPAFLAELSKRTFPPLTLSSAISSFTRSTRTSPSCASARRNLPELMSDSSCCSRNDRARGPVAARSWMGPTNLRIASVAERSIKGAVVVLPRTLQVRQKKSSLRASLLMR